MSQNLLPGNFPDLLEAEMRVQTFIDYKTYLLLLMKGPTNSNINNTYAAIPYLVYIEVDQLEVGIVLRDSVNLGYF